MRDQTTLILGGGVGGVVAANALRRRLPRRHRVVVVDREPDFSLAASFLWVMTGDRRPAQITRPLARLARKGIEVMHGEVERVEPAERRAVVSGRTIEADHVVVALGAEFTPQAVPGLADAGHTFCTLAGAVALRDALAGFQEGRVVVLTAAPAYKCPAAPYEAAMLIDALLRKRGVRGGTTIEVHSAEPAPMGVAGPNASAAVRGMLEAKGIDYHPEHQIARAEQGSVTFTDGATVDADLLVYVPPIAPPAALRGSGLVDEAGWVRVDRYTMETSFPNVYAVGDVTLIPLAMGKPLPRAGVFAHAQAEAVARNIAATVAGKAAIARFDGHGACFIETGAGAAPGAAARGRACASVRHGRSHARCGRRGWVPARCGERCSIQSTPWRRDFSVRSMPQSADGRPSVQRSWRSRGTSARPDAIADRYDVLAPEAHPAFGW